MSRAAGKPLANESVAPGVIISEIYKEGGIRSFYRGIDSALTRQILYGTVRLGLYRTLYENINKKNGKVTFFEKT
jgi:solute carrier family 25 oxoglutarate transporter 11